MISIWLGERKNIKFKSEGGWKFRDNNKKYQRAFFHKGDRYVDFR